ncbi:MAG: acyltransferase [Candidatus Sericytochromatia bacterium]|nr:acyltransferase [Candidatus Sericytochromatia bacterium]
MSAPLPPRETPAPLRTWLSLLKPGRWGTLLKNLVYARRCTSLGGPMAILGWPELSNDGELHIGKGLNLMSHLARISIGVYAGAAVRIGENVVINNGTIISARCGVSIGDGTGIGYHVLILDSDGHPLAPGRAVQEGPITIGKHVWLASRACILQGVTIGDGAVVATGAVVTRDVPAYSVVAGVPARVVRQLTPEQVPWRFHPPERFSSGRG